MFGTTVLFHVDFFFLSIKWPSSWSSLSVFRLLMWPFISKRHNCKQWRNTLQTYRSAKKLYTITYVAFYQLKQPQHILMQRETNSTFDGSVCVIFDGNTTPGSPASGRVTDWHPQLLHSEPARSTHKGHTTILRRPASDRVTQWEDCPTGYGNSQAACFELWAPQEPDIKVALLNQVPFSSSRRMNTFSGSH